MEDSHNYLSIFNFSVFLKMYIFEVETFYLAYYLSSQLNFFSGSMYLEDSCSWWIIFPLSNWSHDNWKNVFFLFPWQRLLGKNPFIKSQLYRVPRIISFVKGFIENVISLSPKHLVQAKLLRKHVNRPVKL